MVSKKIAILLSAMFLILCGACAGESNSVDSTAESSSTSTNSVGISVLRPCFKAGFIYDTFADINEDLSEKGTDAFYEVLPKNLGALIPYTENNSKERKEELKVAFSGYTYIPQYGDTSAIIVDSIQMEIPSSACYNEYYSPNHESDFELDTRLTYLARIETPDGDGSNYACVHITHNKDYAAKCKESWVRDNNQLSNFYVEGKVVEGIVKNNGLEIQLVADTDTVINMSFHIDLNNPYNFGNVDSDIHLRELSQELYSGEWLSKISFEKINLWDISGYENLKYESEIIIP